MYFMQNSKSNLPEAVKKELLKLPAHQDWVIPNIHIAQQPRAVDLRYARRVPCTCGQDDGLHEWDCAISRANR